MQKATVRERIAAAQASGDPQQIRAALYDAQAAGADEGYISAALAELDRVEAAQAAPPSIGPQEPPEKTAEELAAEALELRSRAEALKKQGNERLKANTKSGAKEALEFFTRGLEQHCSDLVLNAQLYGNRAHVHMLLRQFVEAVDDCRKAIDLDPKNIKAYWRAAKASLSLDLDRNAQEFCERGLQQEPGDADLAKLLSTCNERLAAQQQRRSELAARGPKSAPSAAAPSDFSADEAMALQEKVNGFGEQLDSLRMSLLRKQRERATASLTLANLQDTPAEAPLYRGLGRCFLRHERSEVEESLSSTVTSLDAELPKLSSTYQELEKRKQEAEKELTEMVQSFRKQSEPIAAA